MTKLETVRALNNSGPQLQIVESVRSLQQDMKLLPEAVATEVVQALEPLRSLKPLAERMERSAQACQQAVQACQHAARQAEAMLTAVQKGYWRRRPVELGLAVLLGATLGIVVAVVIGLGVSRSQAPSVELQRQAAIARTLWAHATPKERRMMEDILKRAAERRQDK